MRVGGRDEQKNLLFVRGANFSGVYVPESSSIFSLVAVFRTCGGFRDRRAEEVPFVRETTEIVYLFASASW